MAHFRDLQLKGPAWGYFPEPTKSILVVSEQNLSQAKEYFRGMGVQVVTGADTSVATLEKGRRRRSGCRGRWRGGPTP